MSNTTRCFIAIELEPLTQKALHSFQEDLKSLDIHVSWVKPKNMHLTLKFLGDVKDKKLKSLTEDFSRMFEGIISFSVSIDSLGAFPNLEKPRIIWAGINDNASRIIEIAQKVEHGCGQLGFKKERETFIPHLTLGRLRGTKNLEKLSKTLTEADHLPHLTQNIKTITLFKSTLSSQGSIYEKCASHTLPNIEA